MKPPDTSALVANLSQPGSFPHPVERIGRLETHISWIILTGSYAYKIKKPVDLGFLDFSTLEARRRYCEEELRLNRRYAPSLYLEVVPIGGAPEAPRIGATPAIEYAVRMREFPQDALASRRLARGELTAGHLTGFAERLASLHAAAEAAPAGASYGTPETIGRFALDNFRVIGESLHDEDRETLNRLATWTTRELERCYDTMLKRRAEGRVRECHGDLHLGNVVLQEGALVPFDCIEFSAELRWIDVMSEVAFLMMDLLDRGAPPLAWAFINAYLEATGDYAGLEVLRFYLVYRAMVRAKVHLLRALQAGSTASGEATRLQRAFREYLRLAEDCSRPAAPALLIMHGYSGCGKSTVALTLACELGAIRVRSDVERKRLAGLSPLQRSGSGLHTGLYREAATAATYERLAELADIILRAGLIGIVDAAFLTARQRSTVSAPARAAGAATAIVRVNAPLSLLKERIAARAGAGADPSEATLEVLSRQQALIEAPAAGEGLRVIDVDGSRSLNSRDLEPLREWLGRTATRI
jgi:uncharacterized protein